MYQLFACESLKTKENFQCFSSKGGRGRSRDVVVYNRFQIIQWFDLENFGILENLSLRRGGLLRGLVATGGSTVL